VTTPEPPSPSAPEPPGSRGSPQPRAKPLRGRKPGDQRVRVERPHASYFRYAAPGVITARPKAAAPRTAAERLSARVRRVFVGSPLATEQEIEERLPKKKALAILSSDAISSSAYAPEEILRVLVLGGAAALMFSVPVAIAISLLLALVAISYRQICHAYPSGGGAYAVAMANLPKMFALVAAAALLIDYVMTVAVSTSSAVEQIYSAVPALYDLRVELAVLAIAIITVGNLRGIRESGNIFALPTYLFIFTALLVVGIGLFKALVLHDPAAVGYTAADVPPPTEALGLLLLVRAFAAGSVALTGTEAIANGVPVFKPPEPKNAANTLIVMALLLGVIFVGMAFMAALFGILPVDAPTKQSVPALLAQVAFGNGPMFYVFQLATALILILASNTSFNAFPRLAAILAQDGYFPRQFAFRGDRLAFTAGIVILGLVAAVLMVLFGADAHLLIPLYSVGVFVSFTISQAGMVRHWHDEHGPGWRRRLLTNAIGMVLTATVAVVVSVIKFPLGAWIVFVLGPALVVLMLLVHRFYARQETELAVREDVVFGPPGRRERVVVPIQGLTRVTVQAVSFARTISDDVRVVFISDDVEEGERLRTRFERQLPGVPLTIVESPYRQLVNPFLSYLDVMDPDPEAITVVILPEFATRHWWERFLANQGAARLRRALVGRPNTVIASMPYRREQ
jgi:amino acid transporter